MHMNSLEIYSINSMTGAWDMCNQKASGSNTTAPFLTFSLGKCEVPYSVKPVPIALIYLSLSWISHWYLLANFKLYVLTSFQGYPTERLA